MTERLRTGDSPSATAGSPATTEPETIPIKAGCIAVSGLALFLGLGVIGLFLLWESSDAHRASREMLEHGTLTRMRVVGTDERRTRGAGRNGHVVTHHVAQVVPVDAESETPVVDVAISRAEFLSLVPGDVLEVWRLGLRAELDRVVRAPLPFHWGVTVLGAAGLALLVCVLAVRSARRSVASSEVTLR